MKKSVHKKSPLKKEACQINYKLIITQGDKKC
nr:MAG TPA: hypothetical protein [Caudoviricetes sp.]